MENWAVERGPNKKLLDKIALSSLYFERNGFKCATVLDKNYAITTLHCFPKEDQKLATTIILFDFFGKKHQCHIHGICSLSDYIVFKKDDGNFEYEPGCCVVCPLDKYIAVVSDK